MTVQRPTIRKKLHVPHSALSFQDLTSSSCQGKVVREWIMTAWGKEAKEREVKHHSWLICWLPRLAAAAGTRRARRNTGTGHSPPSLDLLLQSPSAGPDGIGGSALFSPSLQWSINTTSGLLGPHRLYYYYWGCDLSQTARVKAFPNFIRYQDLFSTVFFFLWLRLPDMEIYESAWLLNQFTHKTTVQRLTAITRLDKGGRPAAVSFWRVLTEISICHDSFFFFFYISLLLQSLPHTSFKNTSNFNVE